MQNMHFVSKYEIGDCIRACSFCKVLLRAENIVKKLFAVFFYRCFKRAERYFSELGDITVRMDYMIGTVCFSLS